MNLEQKKVRTSAYYSIGYIPCIGKYVLSCIVSWTAWYERYYEITKEEYELYKTNIEKLDALADRCYREGVQSERFLFSQRADENTYTQVQAYRECWSESLKLSDDCEII